MRYTSTKCNKHTAEPFFTQREWDEIVHAARQARTFRAYEAAGKRAGNEAQRLGMACSARNWERDVRRFARVAIAKAKANQRLTLETFLGAGAS